MSLKNYLKRIFQKVKAQLIVVFLLYMVMPYAYYYIFQLFLYLASFSHFFCLEILRLYFKEKLEELSTIIAAEYEDGCESQIYGHQLSQEGKISPGMDNMDIDSSYHVTVISSNNSLVKSIGKVVHDLRTLGFTSLTEDAYASAIFFLLKVSVLLLKSITSILY